MLTVITTSISIICAGVLILFSDVSRWTRYFGFALNVIVALVSLLLLYPLRISAAPIRMASDHLYDPCFCEKKAIQLNRSRGACLLWPECCDPCCLTCCTCWCSCLERPVDENRDAINKTLHNIGAIALFLANPLFNLIMDVVNATFSHQHEGWQLVAYIVMAVLNFIALTGSVTYAYLMPSQLNDWTGVYPDLTLQERDFWCEGQEVKEGDENERQMRSEKKRLFFRFIMVETGLLIWIAICNLADLGVQLYDVEVN